jgi:hypothetical protein
MWTRIKNVKISEKKKRRMRHTVGLHVIITQSGYFIPDDCSFSR